MRPLSTLLMATAMMLLPLVGSSADDEDAMDCRLSCAGERDTRNMDCPSPFDALDDERSQCLGNSQAEYKSCLSNCPTPSSPALPNSEGSQQELQTGVPNY